MSKRMYGREKAREKGRPTVVGCRRNSNNHNNNKGAGKQAIPWARTWSRRRPMQALPPHPRPHASAFRHRYPWPPLRFGFLVHDMPGTKPKQGNMLLMVGAVAIGVRSCLAAVTTSHRKQTRLGGGASHQTLLKHGTPSEKHHGTPWKLGPGEGVESSALPGVYTVA